HQRLDFGVGALVPGERKQLRVRFVEVSDGPVTDSHRARIAGMHVAPACIFATGESASLPVATPQGTAASSSSVSSHAAAAALARTWAALVAPHSTDPTPSCAASQAIASSSSECPHESANLPSASTRSKFSSVATDAKYDMAAKRDPSGK